MQPLYERPYSVEELNQYSYRALQRMSKSMSLPSNVKKVILIELINAKTTKSQAELDAIIQRVKYERLLNTQIRAKGKKKSGLQGTEISSTNRLQSPPINIAPKQCKSPEPNDFDVCSLVTYKPKIEVSSQNTSDRVLRSYNVKNYKRPNYSLINSPVMEVGKSEQEEAPININKARRTPRANPPERSIIKKSNSNIMDRISILKKYIPRRQTAPAHAHTKQIAIAVSSSRQPNNMAPSKSSHLVHTMELVPTNIDQATGLSTHLPMDNLNGSGLIPKRRISGVYTINPKIPFPLKQEAPTFGVRRADGKISKINAIIKKTAHRITYKSNRTQVTIQDLINRNIDAQTFTKTNINYKRQELKNKIYPRQDTCYQRQDTGYQRDATGYQGEDPGIQMLDTGYQGEDTRYEMQDTGYQMQDINYQQQYINYQTEDTRYQKNYSSYQRQDTEYQKHDTGFQEENTGYQMQDTGYQMPEDTYQMQDTGYQMEDTGYQMEDTGYQMEDTGYQMKDTGYQMEDTGYQMQDTGYQMQDTGYQMQEDTGYQVQDTGYQMQDIGYQMSEDTGYQMQETGYQMPEDTGYQMQETGYQVQDTGYQMQDTGCHMQDISYQQLFINYKTENSKYQSMDIENTSYQRVDTNYQGQDTYHQDLQRDYPNMSALTDVMTKQQILFEQRKNNKINATKARKRSTAVEPNQPALSYNKPDADEQRPLTIHDVFGKLDVAKVTQPLYVEVGDYDNFWDGLLSHIVVDSTPALIPCPKVTLTSTLTDPDALSQFRDTKNDVPLQPLNVPVNDSGTTEGGHNVEDSTPALMRCPKVSSPRTLTDRDASSPLREANNDTQPHNVPISESGTTAEVPTSIPYNKPNEQRPQTVIYAVSEMRGKSPSRPDKFVMSCKEENHLPKIQDTFNKFNSMKYGNQPFHTNATVYDINHIGDVSVLDKVPGLKIMFYYTLPPSQHMPPLKMANTECVYSAPPAPSATQQPKFDSVPETTASSEQDNDKQFKYAVNEISDDLPSCTEQEITLRKYRDVMNQSVSSTESQFSQESDTPACIPKMVEHILNRMSQDADDMEVRVQCVFCAWTGGTNLLLYNHIRNDHSTAITVQGGSEWSVTFTLGSLSDTVWGSDVSECGGQLYIVSARYKDPDCFMATFTTISTDDDNEPKMGTITVYKKVTGEPYIWHGQITDVPSNMPNENEPNCLTVELSKLDLLPNSANIKLQNKSLVSNSPSKVVVGQPDLNDIHINIFVQVHN